MLVFCPRCGNLLIVECTDESAFRFKCQTCPYIHKIKNKVADKHFSKLKAVDDVLGGEEAWKNVEKTAARCPKCEYDEAYFMQMQTRSADEPMTIHYRCAKCSHQWREQ